MVADDGSGTETRDLLESYRPKVPFKLVHSWQEDLGFRKTAALNGAIRKSTGEYLIFSDGDCIPRTDFVATHLKHAGKDRYLSGGYVKLSESVSNKITNNDVESGSVFKLRWLMANGMRNFIKIKKIWFPNIANHVSIHPISWSGNNASTFRDNILAVNGFNENMGYMLEDLEFGYRLKNFGVKPKQIRYSAVVCHLYHERPYRDEQAIKKHREIVRETLDSGKYWVGNGIMKRDQARCCPQNNEVTQKRTEHVE